MSPFFAVVVLGLLAIASMLQGCGKDKAPAASSDSPSSNRTDQGNLRSNAYQTCAVYYDRCRVKKSGTTKETKVESESDALSTCCEEDCKIRKDKLIGLGLACTYRDGMADESLATSDADCCTEAVEAEACVDHADKVRDACAKFEASVPLGPDASVSLAEKRLIQYENERLPKFKALGRVDHLLTLLKKWKLDEAITPTCSATYDGYVGRKCPASQEEPLAKHIEHVYPSKASMNVVYEMKKAPGLVADYQRLMAKVIAAKEEKDTTAPASVLPIASRKRRTEAEVHQSVLNSQED
eukprot:TRINITY_DN49956_c0_g1_i1.p1 TRINITY_DN49956_c0_g1~~TRINITY_DN49956_c0_g1_i1.p1  ORF type:complete len:297 (-),score=55.65 TRINITY_DN49956_c0_g1_i1:55-945(-)